MVITLLAIGGALVSVMGTVGFLEFIYEEALQTQAFTTKAAIDLKNWSLAQQQLNELRSIANQMKAFAGTVAWLNPLSKAVFDNVVRATFNQIEVYQEIINNQTGVASLWTNEFAQQKSQFAPEDLAFPVLEPNLESSGTCLEVFDGDTLVYETIVKGAGEFGFAAVPIIIDELLTFVIRLAGVNTPERGKKGYQEAKDYVITQCLGKTIEVKVDPFDVKGKYGRIIGAVYVNGRLLNYDLIAKGYAVADFAKVHKYFTPDLMRQAMQEAATAGVAPGTTIKVPVFTNSQTIKGRVGEQVITRDAPDSRLKRTHKEVKYRYASQDVATKKDHDIITDEETSYENTEDVKVRTTTKQPLTTDKTSVKSYGLPVTVTPVIPVPVVPILPVIPEVPEFINAEIIKAFNDGTQIY